MEEEIVEIFEEFSSSANNGQMSVITEDSYSDVIDALIEMFTKFTYWKDDLNCPFSVHYNGENPKEKRISYEKGSKLYTLDQVFEFWNNNIKPEKS